MTLCFGYDACPMQVAVKLFAILRDRAGVSELSLDLTDNATAQSAIDVLGKRHPELASLLARAATAINREYAPRDSALHDGDELALIPPVSGG